MTEKTEGLKKKVERYKKLLADKTQAQAPPERLRLFKKKLKRWQRRMRKLAKPAKKTEEGAAPKKEEAKA